MVGDLYAHDGISSGTVTESVSASDLTAPVPLMFKPCRERQIHLEKIGSYKVGRTLGRGNFATVRIAYHETVNSKVAMKIVNKRTLDPENLIKIEREIEILQKVEHPFIVKLYEVLQTEGFLYIVTEYVGSGELFDMLMDKGRQTEDESRRLFQQIASAVFYCHAKGIVHRDLKAENLLLDKKGNIKLIDFGFSNYQTPGQLLSTWCGSPPYAAPELLLAQRYDGRLSDVWSLGVILYILVTAGFPFPGKSVNKLKHAVLGDHLKIPFWVSVECSDLIRKMLTVSPLKRYSMQNVIQHRWFTSKIPDNICELLRSLPNVDTQLAKSSIPLNFLSTKNSLLSPRQLDSTVLIFMQQHTGWAEDQIIEKVLSRNYFSPVFATYELLLSKLNELKDAEGCLSFRLDKDNTRKGFRGSILSGKANVDPESVGTTIPAHHLVKLSLATNTEYDSDESSASDFGGGINDCEPIFSFHCFSQQQKHSNSLSQHQHTGGGSYKTRRRKRLEMLSDEKQQVVANLNCCLKNNTRRHTLCAPATGTDRLLLNPLLSAAQQFSVDTQAWANAAAEAAMFATQIHYQNHQQQLQELHSQKQLQHAALNLVSLHSFPLEYARMMHVPNQERRASANEALLGLNNYGHLLAACSKMRISTIGNTETIIETSRKGTNATSLVQNTTSNCNKALSVKKSVEEERESYLSQHGYSKRNTVFAAMSQGVNGILASSSSQRHAKTPYFKQYGALTNVVSGRGSCDAASSKRRSSWASTSSTYIAGLNISAQQQAQLENLYRQSIGLPGSSSVFGDTYSGSMGGINFYSSESLSGVQQLQIEFQKLCALTTGKDSKNVAVQSPGTLPSSSSYNVINSLLDCQIKAPTISITDENNQCLLSSSSPQQSNLKIGFSFSRGCDNSTTTRSSFQQRPATAIGLTSTPSGSITNSADSVDCLTSESSKQQHLSCSPKSKIKFIYVPVSIVVALERLKRYVNTKTTAIRYEAQPTTYGDGADNNAIKIRITPNSGKTILELTLFRMEQSPNISKAIFTMIQGNVFDYKQLRNILLSLFNEVY